MNTDPARMLQPYANVLVPSLYPRCIPTAADRNSCIECVYLLRVRLGRWAPMFFQVPLGY